MVDLFSSDLSGKNWQSGALKKRRKVKEKDRDLIYNNTEISKQKKEIGIKVIKK